MAEASNAQAQTAEQMSWLLLRLLSGLESDAARPERVATVRVIGKAEYGCRATRVVRCGSLVAAAGNDLAGGPSFAIGAVFTLDGGPSIRKAFTSSSAAVP